MKQSLRINGIDVAPGQRVTIDLTVPPLYTHTAVSMPVHVINGNNSGPRLFVSAAVHGDEINGIEIIRRLLKVPALKTLRGTLIAVPVVNVYGFVNQSRYLPDRRDLNRSFPGSHKGSLAARLAWRFMEEIVANSNLGIDLHTGAIHRENLPQVRASIEDKPATERLARAFGAPVIIDADLRDGSLRQAVMELGIPMLLYEAGEALRFDEVGIRAGVKGIISVMREVGMLRRVKRKGEGMAPVLARSTVWLRSPMSGVVRALVSLGSRVKKDELLGVVADPFGENEVDIRAPVAGIIIGRLNLPLVHEGEALFHLARFEKGAAAHEVVEAFQAELEPAPTDREPPIV